MDADDHEPLATIFLMPLFHVRFDIPTVVTTERPELDQDDLALEIGKVESLTVQPRFVVDLRRRHADAGSRVSPQEKDSEENTGQCPSGLLHPCTFPWFGGIRSENEAGRVFNYPAYFAIAIAGAGYFVRSVTVI